ncbi:hypothetical protein CYMTET_13574 [Cymbomonas tetramitiformis]|uniref:Uncharacterized protein n=1 Tax=Cymbomonas tetramitiformis TaxID=36881 RepID=A0AAE0LAX7_9CHLO|nr:hypothetical protein CYMTET_13574 [Cymbomonas tetramitiformis]
MEIPTGDLRDEETLTSVVKKTPSPESVELSEEYEGGATEKEEQKDPGSHLHSPKSPSYDPVSPPYDPASSPCSPLGMLDMNNVPSKEMEPAGVTAASETREPLEAEATPPISGDSSYEEVECELRRKKAKVEYVVVRVLRLIPRGRSWSTIGQV